MSTAGSVTAVTLHFDPACPWTWRTSRWLVGVTEGARLPLSYRAFELSNAAPLETVPERRRASATASRSFLRAVEAAHADGGDDVIGAFYTAYGNAVHDHQANPSLELVEESLAGAGGDHYLAALGDEALDAAVAASRAAAQGFAGDDTGSPVIVLSIPDGQRGFFGPVLAPTPTGADAHHLWDVVTGFAALPQVFELKSRRAASP